MTRFIGDCEPGQNVLTSFNTRRADGSPSNQVEAVGGGPPTWQIVRLSDGAVDSSSVLVELNANPGGTQVDGLHAVSIDTTNETFYKAEDTYIFRANDVAVFNGDSFINVSGEALAEFTLVNRTAGFVLTRSHKIFDGTITQVVDNTTFRITGSGINTTTPGFYVAEQMVFQPPSANQGLSRVVVGYDNVTQQVIVDEPFPVTPAVGEAFDMLHGQPLPLVTANIVLRAGSGTLGQGGLTDAISVTWHRNGEIIPKALAIQEIPVMTLTVYSITYPSGLPVTTLIETVTDQPIDQDTGTFQFALTSHQSQVNDGLLMECAAVVGSTNRQVTDSRVMFVSPAT